jgi:hypothetical protein
MIQPFSPELIGQWIREIKGDYWGRDAAFNLNELRRMSITAGLIPRASSEDATLVDVGGWIPWFPIYRELGYRKVIVVVRPHGSTMLSGITMPGLGDRFEVDICESDVEKDAYAIPDSIASIVVCFEVLEHMYGDPMYLLAECNRVLCDRGTFCLTTPNVLGRMNLIKHMFGEHPFGWSVYTGLRGDRHNREYTPKEIAALGEAAGFLVNELYTKDTADSVSKLRWMVGTIFAIPGSVSGKVGMRMRNQSIFAKFQKQGPVKDRYPSWLYELFGRECVS